MRGHKACSAAKQFSYSDQWEVLVMPIPRVFLFWKARLLLLSLVSAACAYENLGGNSVASDDIVPSDQTLTFATLPAPYDSLPVQIVNVGSGMCLDIPNADGSDAVALQQFPCHGDRNQIWFFARSDAGKYQIRSGLVGGRALAVHAARSTDGTSITNEDTANYQQIFRVVAQSDGSYEIVSDLTGKCFDIEGFSTVANARLQQWSCHGDTNQRFFLRF
jgi:hypothetical protein